MSLVQLFPNEIISAHFRKLLSKSWNENFRKINTNTNFKVTYLDNIPLQTESKVTDIIYQLKLRVVCPFQSEHQ